jgi:hypothetical protein
MIVADRYKPYEVSASYRNLFATWLKTRGGIVVYENHILDSHALGHTTFMPAMFEGIDDRMHPAPSEYCPHGGIPSLREQRVDHIMLEDFGNDVERCLQCFKFIEEQYLKIIVKVKDDSREGYGKAAVRVPFASIDWLAADSPKKSLGLDDVYEVDLELWNEGEASPVDTAAWDRS